MARLFAITIQGNVDAAGLGVTLWEPLVSIKAVALDSQRRLFDLTVDNMYLSNCIGQVPLS